MMNLNGATRRLLSAFLVAVLMMVVVPPVAGASTSGGLAHPQVSEQKGDDQEAQYAHIIRAVLMGASAVWRAPWFQNMVVNGVRVLSSSAAANAVRNCWTALGRTVDNLIGTQTLTWTVVRDNFTRTLTNEGYRSVAKQAGLAMEQYFRSLVNFFD